VRYLYGGVTNYKACEERAAQYIRSYFDKDFLVIPPFESWEFELYPVSSKYGK